MSNSMRETLKERRIRREWLDANRGIYQGIAVLYGLPLGAFFLFQAVSHWHANPWWFTLMLGVLAIGPFSFFWWISRQFVESRTSERAQ